MVTEIITVTIPAAPAAAYDVVVGPGAIADLGSRAAGLFETRRATVVTNDAVWAVAGDAVTDALAGAAIAFDLVSIPDGESFKNLETVGVIYDALTACQAGRADPIVAVGGGVIGDISGYVAATYMRGVPLINVPTTLLAMADSSIGGKTAIDLPAGKNLAGAFHQPSLVVSDTAVLTTLPATEAAAGRAEMLKAAMLAGGTFLADWRASAADVVAGQQDATTRLLRRAIEFKAEIAALDERDVSGRRAILNYGHTLAHALETKLGYAALGHGAAVAIGMSFAARLSQVTGLCTRGLVHETDALLEDAGLAARPPAANADDIIAIMEMDKKNQGGEINFVLLEDFGRPAVRSVPRATIRSALEEFLNG